MVLGACYRCSGSSVHGAMVLIVDLRSREYGIWNTVQWCNGSRCNGFNTGSRVWYLVHCKWQGAIGQHDVEPDDRKWDAGAA